MTGKLVRSAAGLAAVLLSLTACSAGGQDSARPGPSATADHPVFGQKTGRQVFLALRETQKAGTARFTQKLTFAGKKGDLVRTMTGSLDFAADRGSVAVTWDLPAKTSAKVRTAVLGFTPSREDGETSGTYLVDRDRTRYRAASSPYWIDYAPEDTEGVAKSFVGEDPLEFLRGSEAPVGGTLLEAVGAGTATSYREGKAGGRVYRAGLPDTTLELLFPPDLGPHLVTAGASAAQRPPVPLAVEVDGQGRLTRAGITVKDAFREDGDLTAFTTLTMDLTLTGYGSPVPSPAPGDRVLKAADVVRDIAEVREGGCVDFTTGQRNSRQVVTVSCGASHDARITGQHRVAPGADPEETTARSQAVCGRGIWAWWTPPEEGTGTEVLTTCYEVS
ncbi:hypothetical protein ACFFSH_18200 [Streptomyces filamentosus]|uniref:Lipoprotein n=1 Tax=Streptomyces filamentosus TaxID=67294 RepID=A0A919BUB0_STRFL|nr:hypothetical protein [Streptomyces filamentosus]GHG16747.1 hypothetical protein GCM10017667_58420 [Streptomyces filamentosus]